MAPSSCRRPRCLCSVFSGKIVRLSGGCPRSMTSVLGVWRCGRPSFWPDIRPSRAARRGPRPRRAAPAKPGWAGRRRSTAGGDASVGPPGVAERLPGATQGTTAYGRLHQTVGELCEHDRYAQAQGEQGKPAEGYVQLRTGNHIDWPVPEVDAVGADAEPAHRGRPKETRDHPGARVDDNGYQEGRDERHRHKTSPVEGRLELAQHEAEKDQGEERGDANEVQQQRHGRPPPASEAARTEAPEGGPLVCGAVFVPRRPQEGERRSTQQPRCPRVRPKVDSRRVHPWVV